MDSTIRFTNERTAIALLNAGNPAGAEARLRTMLADDPNDATALALMAHCRLRLDDRKGALERARAAAAINPDDWMVRRALLATLMANGKYKDAEPIAEGLAADTPDDSGVLFQLAVARLSRHQYREAAELFDQAEASAGGDAYDLLTIAYQRLRQWRFAEAEELARGALKLDPTHHEIFYIIGECALAQNRPDEAYTAALEALRLAPDDKATMRLVARAGVRKDGWLKPFVPGIDWILEMDRGGLFILPLFVPPLLLVMLTAAWHDVMLVARGQAPILILALGVFAILLYGVICYANAISARLRIRKDLKKIALPRF